MAEDYGLSKSELAQIDAMAAAAAKPNINLMAGMIAGDPQTANMSSQVQAQQFRGGQARVGGLRNALQAQATSRDTATRQGVLQSARTGAAKKAAEVKRSQDEQDYTRDRADTMADLEFKRQQALDLAELRNQRVVSQGAKEDARLNRQERAFRMRHQKTQQPKTLSNSESTRLADSAKMIGVMRDNLATFKDEYVTPEAGVVGRTINLASQEFGMFTSPESDARAAWWEQYKRFIELVERHEFFGATLTKGEDLSWKSAEINLGNKPDKLRRNLRKRIKRLEDDLGRYSKGIAISRKNPKAVMAMLGKHMPKSYMPTEEEYIEPFPEDVLLTPESGPAATGFEDVDDDEFRQKLIEEGLDPAEYGL